MPASQAERHGFESRHPLWTQVLSRMQVERTSRRSGVRAETQTIRKSSEFGKARTMGRRRKGEPPRYRLHKHSGQAVVSLPRGDGTYRDVLLGPYDTPESRLEYARVIAEWEANVNAPPRPVPAN